MVQGARGYLDQPPVVFLCGLHDTLPGGPPGAEGGHERAVRAAQDNYVWVRLVYVVVELGEEQFVLTHSPANASRGGSATVYDQPLLSLSQGNIFIYPRPTMGCRILQYSNV